MQSNNIEETTEAEFLRELNDADASTVAQKGNAYINYALARLMYTHVSSKNSYFSSIYLVNVTNMMLVILCSGILVCLRFISTADLKSFSVIIAVITALVNIYITNRLWDFKSYLKKRLEFLYIDNKRYLRLLTLLYEALDPEVGIKPIVSNTRCYIFLNLYANALGARCAQVFRLLIFNVFVILTMVVLFVCAAVALRKYYNSDIWWVHVICFIVFALVLGLAVGNYANVREETRQLNCRVKAITNKTM